VLGLWLTLASSVAIVAGLLISPGLALVVWQTTSR
jgi:hypothetical protein